MLTTRVIPTSGEAWVGGIDVVAHPAAAKKVIGVVPQTNTLDRSLDVAENLFFHGRYFGMNAREAHQRTDELLVQFRLSDRARAGADELSGGMAQRLMVARAIMHDPDVLFLDEPTSGLDPQSRLALWDVVRELHAIGQTILLTTHYMEEAEHLCDRVAIVDHGRVIALGTPRELVASLRAEHVLEFAVSDTDQVDERTLAALEGVCSATRRDGSYRLQVEELHRTVPALVAELRRQGAQLSELRTHSASLEDVFVTLTGRHLRDE
jgi:ABC-2 type transport system ATP-binding protein